LTAHEEPTVAIADHLLNQSQAPQYLVFKVVPRRGKLRDRHSRGGFQFGQTIDRSKPLTRQILQQMSEEMCGRWA